jgi:choline dehydrogenase-like flavoprotein
LCDGSPGEIEADVLVIGAGIAGLILACELAKKGIKTVVLESGGRHQEGETHPLNEVIVRGDRYSGAEAGRFRCLGGTSTRWGGAMIPFLPEDMPPDATSFSPGWGAVTYDEVMRYLPQAEQLFRLPEDGYGAPGAPDLAEYAARLAKWPKFTLRNVATLLRDTIDSPSGPLIWLNATAAVFEVEEGERLKAVKAKAPNGGWLKVSAGITVIASGAIESTRLLLLLDRDAGERVFAPDGILGRYFYDHLSATAAGIFPKDVRRFSRLFGFRFERNIMRSLRYELTNPVLRRDSLPGAFFHVAFVADESSGFAGLRDVMRKLQRRTLPGAKEMTRLVMGSRWLAQAVWWRYAERRLLAPAGTAFELIQVIEQDPCRDNRISLSSNRADAFGCPLAVIDWRVTNRDLSNFANVTESFLQNWNASSLAGIAEAVRRPLDDEAGEMIAGGIYHPGGSIRIGRGPHDGVVSGDLKTFRVPNVRVVSTAVFPNGGTANPTLMLMLFACRAADQIHTQLAQ